MGFRCAGSARKSAPRTTEPPEHADLTAKMAALGQAGEGAVAAPLLFALLDGGQDEACDDAQSRYH